MYREKHPKLLFTRDEIPALYQKVRDGGPDDAAYAYIRYLARSVYPGETVFEMMDVTFGMNFIPNLGLVTYLEVPEDEAARQLGRELTILVADNFDADDNVFFSPVRLRILTFGYDMFFDDGPLSERMYVRDEIETYVDSVMLAFNYERWLHRPYVSNITAMIGSALGLAAICLDGEMEKQKAQAAIARADTFIDTWLRFQLDPDGSYKEGAMYAGWSMRHLIPYFWARKRYDGYDYSLYPEFRAIEKWVAFATLPDGGAKVNNLNDTAYLNLPLSRHHTYFDWAQTAWRSRLSAWIWERLVGPQYGHDSQREADKIATVLWHQNLPPQQPDEILPRHFLWKDRGLYYFRTGWQEAESSDDVVFSFYSGTFHGGHSQEDQNNFTLYGYGDKFAVDNGFDPAAWQSEAHNMIFIDGKGQHHSSGSVGTDGKIREYLLSDYADYLMGDATRAYTTYSGFNLPDHPFPGDDWSWGYDGANPVNVALRRWIVVHDVDTPPYFILVDDIEKDGAYHTYDWRMHTLQENAIDMTENPIRIAGGSGSMDLYVLHPAFDQLGKGIEPFDNQSVDPNTNIIKLSQVHDSPNFTFIMVPGNQSTKRPLIAKEVLPWGPAASLKWGSEFEDIFLLNLRGDAVSYTLFASDSGRFANPTISTDASFAHFRIRNGMLEKYLVSNVSHFEFDGIPFIQITNGFINAALAGSSIRIDRDDADFVFYGPQVETVFFREEMIPVKNENGFITPDSTGGDPGSTRTPGFIGVRVYPNPFNASASVVVEVEESSPATIVIYDARGKRIRELWTGLLSRGETRLEWDGTNDGGEKSATGIYFLRVKARHAERSTKAILLK